MSGKLKQIVGSDGRPFCKNRHQTGFAKQRLRPEVSGMSGFLESRECQRDKAVLDEGESRERGLNDAAH